MIQETIEVIANGRTATKLFKQLAWHSYSKAPLVIRYAWDDGYELCVIGDDPVLVKETAVFLRGYLHGMRDQIEEARQAARKARGK